MQIVVQLEETIAGMGPGEQIPSRRELMKVFGVSEHTVHSALYYLIGKGLVEVRIRGGLPEGVFVKERG